MNATDNPLLDFSGLPRFDAIRAEHVTPGHRPASRRRPRGGRDRRDRRATAHVGQRRRPARRRARPHRPRVGRGQSSQRGREFAGAARGLQRQPAEAHRFPHRSRAGSAPLRPLPRARGGAGLRDERSRAAARDRERAARLPPRGRGAAATRTRRASRRCRRSSPRCRRNSRTTCSTRPTTGRSTSSPNPISRALPDDVLRAARAEAAAEGRSGCKLTLRMPSYLPVMQYARNRELRATLHRAYSTRASELGARPEWDNTAAHPAHSRAAARGSAAPRLRELRGGVAGPQDGAQRRRGDRLPARAQPARRGRSRSPTSPS